MTEIEGIMPDAVVSLETPVGEQPAPTWIGDAVNDARTEAYEAGYKAGERDAYERIAKAAEEPPALPEPL